jgi:hypothetical protein
MRHSRNRKVGGGGDIDEEIKTIEIKLNEVQDSVNKLKEKYDTTSSNTEEPFIKEEETIIKEDGPIQEMIPKPWQEDKNLKFKDGQNGRVTLSFPRIMLLLSNIDTKTNTNKPWMEIKMKLLDATSTQEVQNIINQYKIRFSANSIGGTRKKRHGGKRRRTSKKY